jgi:hypothetical protein
VGPPSPRNGVLSKGLILAQKGNSYRRARRKRRHSKALDPSLAGRIVAVSEATLTSVRGPSLRASIFLAEINRDRLGSLIDKCASASRAIGQTVQGLPMHGNRGPRHD